MHHSQNSSTTTDETTSVLIVGGSLVGLATALFLGCHGVPFILVERHVGTAIHPRLASLTARTMELLRPTGVEPAIRRVEPLFPRDSRVLVLESLVGQEFDRVMEDMSAYFTSASPAAGSLIAQDVLEPILRARATALGGDVRYGTELLDFAQDDAGVTATVRERVSGARRTIRARYLVAADGGRSGIRTRLGIGQHGAGTLAHVISILFDADIGALFERRGALMCIIANDTLQGGFLTPYPRSGPRPAVFRLDVAYDPARETPDDYMPERCLALIRAAVGLPDLVARIHTVLPWEMAARVADRFQAENVFLVGDAARIQPPTGALGGNTGIAEAHNLAWKLAMVLRGQAGPRLLETYDAERRPIADLTVEQVARLSQERQAHSADAITVDTLTVNMGYRYPTGALIAEPSPGDPPLLRHPAAWQGLPGTRAPHVVLRRDGALLSTLDLFGQRFVLLPGSAGQAWSAAAGHVARQLSIPLEIHPIGSTLVDSEGRFGEAYGMRDTGAVLVRPDGIVAWRAPALIADPEQTLRQVFARLLYR
jgi:putative polyketide hydroxylase